MKGKKINIIPVVILIALAIFVYVNSRNPNIASIKTPSVSMTPTQTADKSPLPENTPAGTVNPQSTPAGTAEKYKTETIKDFEVTVAIPEQWVKKPQYDTRYEGSSGFAELTAMSGYGLSLKEAADIQINNDLKPLGDNPKVMNTTIGSQEAAIITPSGSDPKAQSAILVKFPKPLTISGTPYYYLLIWTDREHAEKISNGIKFNM